MSIAAMRRWEVCSSVGFVRAAEVRTGEGLRRRRVERRARGRGDVRHDGGHHVAARWAALGPLTMPRGCDLGPAAGAAAPSLAPPPTLLAVLDGVKRAVAVCVEGERVRRAVSVEIDRHALLCGPVGRHSSARGVAAEDRLHLGRHVLEHECLAAREEEEEEHAPPLPQHVLARLPRHGPPTRQKACEQHDIWALRGQVLGDRARKAGVPARAAGAAARRARG